jgi:hypothetical protein
MKNVSIATALFLSFGLLSVVPANAASSDANAEIVASIAIVNTGALEFGQIIAGPAGTVAVSTASVRTSPSTTLYFANGTTPAAATFDVTGGADSTYSITLPADAAVSLAGPGVAMVVNGFVSSPETGLLTGGTETLSVGATLSVAAAQTPGAYSGTFDVTVAYD